MKKTFQRIMALTLCLMMCLSALPMEARAAGDVVINEKNFPDKAFREFISNYIDFDEDGILSSYEIDGEKVLYINEEGIADLSGIEYFTALKELGCSDNQLTVLDLSKNKTLETVFCENNQLTTLNLGKNNVLETLYCNYNQLSTLDVSGVPALEDLSCTHNQLTSLDFSKNPALFNVFCEENQLKSINVNNNLKLNLLNCNDNNLTTLNVTNNTALTRLICSGNQLKTLDLSKNTKLEAAFLEDNQLTTLDVKNNTELVGLYCHDNQLSALDVSKNTKLEWLYCGYNKLSTLDVSKNTALNWFDCYNNQISTLDVSKNKSLVYLSCARNNIESIDIRNNPKLLEVYHSGMVDDSYDEIEYYFLDSIGVTIQGLHVDKKTTVIDGEIAAPAVTSHPADLTAVAGMTAEFTVKASGEGLKYQWYVQKKGSTTWDKVSGGTKAKLTVTVSADMDGNKYRCEVSNDGGKDTSKAATLTVVSKPKITTQPKKASVKAGKKVTFKVKAVGGNLTYQWYRQKPGTKKWEKISKATKATYSFKAAKKWNGYKFRCLVKNDAGKVYSKAVKLTVKK